MRKLLRDPMRALRSLSSKIESMDPWVVGRLSRLLQNKQTQTDSCHPTKHLTKLFRRFVRWHSSALAYPSSVQNARSELTASWKPASETFADLFALQSAFSRLRIYFAAENTRRLSFPLAPGTILKSCPGNLSPLRLLSSRIDRRAQGIRVKRVA